MSVLKFRARSNDTTKANQLTNNEWVVFDNATEVRFGQRQVTDLLGFKNLCKAVGTSSNDAAILKNYPILTHGNPTRHLIARDIFEEGVELHYNVISWKDRVSGQKHIMVYDTIAFLLNDEGKTLERIEG